MKYVDVSPCFKKEDNLFKGNYRPVSVLAVISKLCETVLLHYICQSLLLKLIEDIKSALDKGHKTGAVFMNLSKAFDCLPHALLIAKLNAYCLSTAACELLSIATSVIGCNECTYQMVEVHGKHWIKGYHRVLFLVPFRSMFLWMICSFSWRDIIYVMTLMITP